MALKKFYKTRTGIDLPESYWRVGRVVGSKTGLVVYVEMFASEQVARDGYPCVEQYEYQFAPTEARRWDAQAYDYLKTQPAFAAAADC